MLMLKRSPEEKIIGTISPQDLQRLADTGNPLTFTILLQRIDRNAAYIGLNAPQELSFVREEIAHRYNQ